MTQSIDADFEANIEKIREMYYHKNGTTANAISDYRGKGTKDYVLASLGAIIGFCLSGPKGALQGFQFGMDHGALIADGISQNYVHGENYDYGLFEVADYKQIKADALRAFDMTPEELQKRAEADRKKRQEYQEFVLDQKFKSVDSAFSVDYEQIKADALSAFDMTPEELPKAAEADRKKRQEYREFVLDQKLKSVDDVILDANRYNFNINDDPYLNKTPEEMQKRYDEDEEKRIAEKFKYRYDDPFLDANRYNLSINDNPYLNKNSGNAIGLPRVPYDNFPALLHEGESVLTKRETNTLFNGLGGVNIAKLSDTIIVREEADIDRIASALTFRIRQAALNMA